MPNLTSVVAVSLYVAPLFSHLVHWHNDVAYVSFLSISFVYSSII